MRLPHDDVGSGPGLVLLHAGIADRSMWSEQLGPLAAAGFRAVAIDLPGFGEAPLTDLDAAWTDVLQTMDAIGLSRAALVGNSYGGAVALRVALVAPERVAALALVSAPPPQLEPSAELRAAWGAEEDALARGDIEAAVEAVLEAWLRADAPASLRERVARMQRRAFETQAAAGEVAEAPDPIQAHPLERLEVPVLVAVGEHDMPDFRTGANALAGQLRTRVEVITGAGHLAPLEQPTMFRELLLDFLARADPTYT